MAGAGEEVAGILCMVALVRKFRVPDKEIRKPPPSGGGSDCMAMILRIHIGSGVKRSNPSSSGGSPGCGDMNEEELLLIRLPLPEPPRGSGIQTVEWPIDPAFSRNPKPAAVAGGVFARDGFAAEAVCCQ